MKREKRLVSFKGKPSSLLPAPFPVVCSWRWRRDEAGWEDVILLQQLSLPCPVLFTLTRLHFKAALGVMTPVSHIHIEVVDVTVEDKG